MLSHLASSCVCLCVSSQVVESAMGGMLFVDEAYALVKDAKDSFGKEALDTLIKLVEDHRGERLLLTCSCLHHGCIERRRVRHVCFFEG